MRIMFIVFCVLFSAACADEDKIECRETPEHIECKVNFPGAPTHSFPKPNLPEPEPELDELP